ncbi:unnamed protein product, partial [Mesorhabditis belari]|uniref:isopentenyl-diphosphate Delta-isomerase n=1 Tax=Mesorhabditis belari TaxID=2138241 RepID=A0AAF3FP55_9BILA
MLFRPSSLIRLATRKMNIEALAQADPIQAQHMKEVCIAVNESDVPEEAIPKCDAHHIESLTLHRAFSVFAFTPDHRLLLQKRSKHKITFPEMWTNTCCSHPLWNDAELKGVEGAKAAAKRKMEHELGIKAIEDDRYLFKGKYLYKAMMPNSPWGEHEMDYVLILRNFDLSRIEVNAEEVENYAVVSLEELKKRLANPNCNFTPWQNWRRMKRKQDQPSKQKAKRLEQFNEPGSLAKKKSIIHIEYNNATSKWEVTRQATKYLQTMGVPGVKGAPQTLYPEEVFYLYEIGSAIVKEKEGRQLIGTEVLALALRAISFSCLMTYREMRRAGFVVVRKRLHPTEPVAQTQATPSISYFDEKANKPSTSEPTINILAETKKSPSEPANASLSLKPFSSTVLDMFPTLENGKMKMIHLAMDQNLSPIHEPISSRIVSPNVIRLTQDMMKRLSTPLAPRFWPNLEELATTASTWSEYREKFKKTMEMNEQRAFNRFNSFKSPFQMSRGGPAHRRGFSRSPLHANTSYTPRPFQRTPLMPKAGTFMHTVVTPPFMRMTVLESSCGNVLSSANPDPTIRSIFAMVSADSVITYIEHSNNPITLQEMKKFVQ